MLPRNHPDRIQIAFDDHRLVANAGLLLPVTLEVWPKSGREGLYSWQSMMRESGHAGRAI